MSSSPTSAASKPSARQRRRAHGVAHAGFGDRRAGRPGCCARSRSASLGVDASVRRSRLLMPMSRASVASAASSSRASCASTSGSRPRSSAARTSRASAALSVEVPRAAAPRRRRRPAAAAAAARPRRTPWPAPGSVVAARSRAQVLEGAAEPVRLDEHRDDRRATGLVGARPRQRRRASPSASAPAEGERRLISAMRWRPGRASGAGDGRGGGRAAARHARARAGVRPASSARGRRAVAAAISSRTDGRRRACAARASAPATRHDRATAPPVRLADPGARPERARSSAAAPRAMVSDASSTPWRGVRPARDHERGARVEHHDVPRAGPRSTPSRMASMIAALAAPRRPRAPSVVGPRQPVSAAVTVASLDARRASRRG